MALYGLFGAYIVGILLATIVPAPDLTGSLCLAALLCLCRPFLRNPRLSWCWLGLLVMLSGTLWAGLSLRPPPDTDQLHKVISKRPVTVQARILQMDDRVGGGYRLELGTERLFISGRSTRVKGDLLLTVRDGLLQARPGQSIRFRTRLRKTHDFGTPGEFSYTRFLAANGIHVTAMVRRAEDIAVLAGETPPLTGRLESYRRDVAERIRTVVPPGEAALVQALTVGSRGGITKTQRKQIAEGGVAHLFAISGLHFGLLALLLYQLLRTAYGSSLALLRWAPPQRVVPILLILPLSLYLALSGGAWATWRAFVMTVVIALLLVSRRRTPSLHLLVLVAFGFLVVNPLAMFQPGFQLSFAGLAGILAWLRRGQAWLLKTPTLVRLPAGILISTTAATLATLPFTIWHFHQFAPAGLLTNLLAIPLVAWGAVPAGLTGIVTLPLWPEVADICFVVAGAIVAVALELVRWCGELPGLASRTVYFTATELIACSACVLCAFLSWHNRTAQGLRVALILLAFLAAWEPWRVEGRLIVTALSVGQGDATLVTLPNGEHYLVDGGGMPGSDFDPGERLIAPALGRLGIDRLTGVILTHDHPDHRDGLSSIIKRIPTDTFWSAIPAEDLEISLREVLAERGVTIRCLTEGWSTLGASPAGRIYLFTPSQSFNNLNERSLVVYTGNQGTGALLTADLGPKGASQLLAAGLPGPVTLLKVPHHGSRSSGTKLLLEALAPSTTFISVGRNNPYRLPHETILAACNSHETTLYRTDLDGTLVFTANAEDWRVDSATSP